MPEQILESPKQFNPLEIHDEEDRLVKGWGSVDIKDNQGQRLPMEEFKKFMPIYMRRGGIITDSHTNKVVGKCLNYSFGTNPVTNTEGVYLTVDVFKDYVYDDMVWNKIKTGEYKGFSFGGINKFKDVVFEKGMNPEVLLKGIEGFEFAFVDGPANAPSLLEEINYIAKSDNSKREVSSEHDEEIGDAPEMIQKITAEEEKEKINENKKLPEAKKRHKFKPAEWTHPNGHPRCLICGDEERTGGFCNASDGKIEKSMQTINAFNLLKSGNIIKSFIKKREYELSKMEDAKKIGEEQTLSLEGLAQEVAQIKQAVAQLVEMVGANNGAEQVAEGVVKQDEDKDKDDDKDKDVEKKEVAKEDVSKTGVEGAAVTLPQEPTEKIQSEADPAGGAETDSVDFVEKSQETIAEGIKKGMEEVTKSMDAKLEDIRKSLGVTKLTTPRPDLSDIKKEDNFKKPASFKEANAMARKVRARSPGIRI